MLIFKFESYYIMGQDKRGRFMRIWNWKHFCLVAFNWSSCTAWKRQTTNWWFLLIHLYRVALLSMLRFCCRIFDICIPLKYSQILSIIMRFYTFILMVMPPFVTNFPLNESVFTFFPLLGYSTIKNGASIISSIHASLALSAHFHAAADRMWFNGATH